MVEKTSYAGKPVNNSVMYITKKVENLVKNLRSVSGCLIYVENGIYIEENIINRNKIIFTNTPQLDYVKYVNAIEEKRFKEDKNKSYSLTKEGYYIGENVKIGNNVYIEPGCLIGHDVVIGDNAYIKAGSRIKNSKIGKNFIACENCTIGTNGFTMTEDEEGNKIRIPTFGKVLIGDNVEINALTNISCGSAGNTVIGDNVKIDSLVHIGHDVRIEKNTELTAGSIIGGFVSIGCKSFVGINSTIKNRKKIGKNSIVGMGSVVTKDTEDNIVVAGVPATKLRDNK